MPTEPRQGQQQQQQQQRPGETRSVDDILARTRPVSGRGQETGSPVDVDQVLAQTRPVQQRPEVTQREAFTQGAAEGGTALLPIMGGIAGGLIATPEPLTSLFGIGLGIAIGMTSREVLREGGARQAQDLPEEVRPAFFAGEVTGASLPFGFGAVGFAQTGARFTQSRIGNFFNRVLDQAERRPGAFIGAEISTTGSAAVFEGMAEATRPGETGFRVGMGIAGGVLNPTQYAIAGVNLGRDAGARALQSMSPAAREGRAAREMQRVLREFGEDPTELARELRRLSSQGQMPTATSAQLTGSPALQNLEAELTRRSARFGGESRRRAEEGFEGMRTMIAALTEIGDPASLREAARLRQTYFDSIIGGRIAVAEQRMIELAERVTPTDASEMSRLSRQSQEIMQGAMDDARRVERDLWSRVPRDTDAASDSILSVANDIVANDLLVDESLPTLVGRFTARMVEQDGQTNVGELLIFRRRMLDEARKAAANNEPAEARMFGRLAEAALGDLDQVDGAASAAISGAREYSRRLNDNFTRAFAGRAMETGRTGAERIPPELMLRRALGSGNELASLRMKELERAVRFGNPDAAEEMLSVQQQYLQFLASEAVDPQTGMVNATRLENLRKRQAGVLENFPELDSILADTAQARRLFDAAKDQGRHASRRINQMAAFGRVAESENPIREVGRILDGPRPERQIGQLARVARRDGDDAVLGLRNAVMTNAFERAGGDTAQFNFERYRRELFRPRRPGQTPVIEMMQRNGIMDEETVSNLDTILRRAESLEQTIRTKPQLETMLDEQSNLFDLTLRVVGSKLPALANVGGATGSGLIMAHAGSRFARQTLDKVPRGRTQDIIIEAAQNPDFMATLLTKPKTSQEKIMLTRRMNAYLWSAGLIRGPQEAQEGLGQEGGDDRAMMEQLNQMQLGGR